MSEVIVLDTHIWIWFINQEFERFPAHWRDAIEISEVVGVSPVSCYEVALAQQRGRLQLPCTTESWLQEALEPSGITLFPITAQIAYKAVNLSPVHKDPFDRLIIATTLVYKAKLASIDGLFSQYSELDTYLMKKTP
ncbi:type II toxin-antitoxin system VapC family toxin [Moorena sp. SIO3H5]|uniref:type II toxin-antitoxin system VapC family toxin n=1 Tax=Moorena sp. SIO3H5 TaxID=2607834 RepID=UPI0013B7BFAC|nr:type II toxin-antitoxin system VapC family toxin [Moorena sp. SIO3H5]NEO71630.1 type II toxin-antitoxin system VapC family toxin [Moorena sp. SIO3H5]